MDYEEEYIKNKLFTQINGLKETASSSKDKQTLTW